MEKLIRDMPGKEAFLLAAMSTFSYLIAMAYEMGRLNFYGIPISFISLDTNIIVTIFVVLFFPLIYVAFLIAQGRLELKSKKSYSEQVAQKLATLSSIILFLTAILIDYDSIKQLLIWAITIFSSVYLTFFGVLAINSLTMSGFDKSKYLSNLRLANNFFSLEGKSFSFKLKVFLLILVISIVIAYLFGFNKQSREKTFWVIEERPDVFLVANYGSRMILKNRDTNHEYFTTCFEVVDVGDVSIKLQMKTLEKSLKKSVNIQNSDSCY